MPALAIAPIDLPAAGPATTPAPKSGEDGLFAARLQVATKQQQSQVIPTTSSIEKPNRNAESKQVLPEPDTEQRDNAVLKETPANSLNGSAGATLQATPLELQTRSTMKLPTGLQGGETTIARMLDNLSKGSEPAIQRAAATTEAMVSVQHVETVTPSQSQLVIAPDAARLITDSGGAPTTGTTQSREAEAGQSVFDNNATIPFSLQLDAAQLPTSATTAPSSITAPREIPHEGGMSSSPQIGIAMTATVQSTESTDSAPQGTGATSQQILTSTAANVDQADSLPSSTLQGTSTYGLPTDGTTITKTTQSADNTFSALQENVTTSRQAETLTTANAAQADTPLYVQNKYGQVIAIQQGVSSDEEGEINSSTASGTTGFGQRLDTNSHYIQSHLPKETLDRGTDQSSGQQDVSTPKPQHNTIATGEPPQPGQALNEQAVLQKVHPSPTTESQPLVFTRSLISSQTTTLASTPEQSTIYHLPSGLIVPEGTVVDQMIAHFSANSRLQTGEVTLRLHPQELGEVRMAIKVEQDNVKAHIIAQNPQAQEMIDRHLPRLREALEQQGLHLHQIEVTVATHDHAGSERFHDNNAWRQPMTSSNRSLPEQQLFTLESDESIAVAPAVANTTLSVLA